jgi:protein-disulfide isomerase
MIPDMRQLSIAAALVLALACSAPAQQASSGSDTAARVGDRAITVKELDDHWQKSAPGPHAQALQALYDGRKEALDEIIADTLIAQAAKAKGVTPEQYMQTEVAKHLKPVTDADVVKFFEENQAQMQGRALADVGPAIRKYLDDQQRASGQEAVIAELRKAGPRIQLLFDAPRQQVNIAADDASAGPATAPITIIEFSDFQCPFCQRVMPTLKRVRETYGDRVRIVWKDFPLTQIHPQAFKAAEAGNCAREQGKFWEYHDRLFANQQALQPEFLKKYAADAGLDASKFNACLDTAKYSDHVQEQMGVGTGLGVGSTPSIFINGRLVAGAQPYETFVSIINEELDRAKK